MSLPALSKLRNSTRSAEPLMHPPLLRHLFLVALAAMACVSGCEPTKAAKVAKNPRVIVTTPITDTVIDYQHFTGRLEAYKAVEIRSRVTGYVTQAIQARDTKANGSKDEEIKAREGDLVKEGDLLFVVDPRQYEADLNQAEA